MRNQSRGFTLIELLIVVAIILIIAGIAIPNLIRSRIAANEASAVENLRTITTASVAYNSTWGNGFPPSLVELGGVTGNPATCNAAILLEPSLTTAPYWKSGYRFAYAGQSGNMALAGPGCSNPGFNGYFVAAVPIRAGITGQRSFCSDTPGVIHFDPTGNTPASVAACDALPSL